MIVGFPGTYVMLFLLLLLLLLLLLSTSSLDTSSGAFPRVHDVDVADTDSVSSTFSSSCLEELRPMTCSIGRPETPNTRARHNS